MTSVQPNQKKHSDKSLLIELAHFWQQGTFASYEGAKSIEIHYAHFTHKDPTSPTLVVVPGRSESYLKYQELALDLYAQGYSIFIIDHRGQGLSDRLLANPNKGYVDDFQNYVDDLHNFIKKIVVKQSTTKPYILAHSMGGAIAIRLMQDFPELIKAAVVSSPMLGFNSGLLPQGLAKLMISSKLRFNRLFSKTPWYFWGQKDYRQTDFSKNKLSHSLPRYQLFNRLYEQNKKIQLGGVTTHWLAESIKAQKEIFEKINLLKTPILLLQAGKDCIVSQEAQNDFCHKLNEIQPKTCPNALPIRVDGAYHELFFEADEYRHIALKQTLAWFTLHKQTELN
jgi:lysophospholipase